MASYAQFVMEGRAEHRPLVKVDRRDDRATVTLSDPERLNALSTGLMVQLVAALTELDGDPALRSIVLTGDGDAFSAGGDLRLIADGTRDIRDAEDPSDTSVSWRWIRNQFGGVVRKIANSDKTFIAAVNGPAAGVGLAFALACDVVLASERAVLVPAFARLGLVPEVGTSWLLTRRLGYHGAFSFYMRGEHADAETALRLGLVGEVHPHAQLLDAAEAWCDRVAAMPAHAHEMSKALLRASADATWEESLRLEEFAEANCFSTQTLESAAKRLLRDAGAEG